MESNRGIRIAFVLAISMVLIICASATAFADVNQSTLDEIESVALDNGLKINLSEFNDADILFYGVKNADNTISLSTEKPEGNRAIFVGSLTKNSWSGSSIDFTISVTATGTTMYAHAGTITMYKVTSGGGVGSVYNAMTFAITSSTPKSKLSDSFNMNTGSLSSIYLGLSNLTVTDSSWNVTVMTTPPKRKFVK